MEVELAAIAQGMLRAKALGRKRILVLSDCKEAITAVNDNESFLSRSGYTLNWIKKKMLNGLDWRLSLLADNIMK